MLRHRQILDQNPVVSDAKPERKLVVNQVIRGIA
jgi:hypothetical protein